MYSGALKIFYVSVFAFATQDKTWLIFQDNLYKPAPKGLNQSGF